MHNAPELQVTVLSEGPRALVQLSGELDITSSRHLQATLDRLLGRRHVPVVHEIVLDVAGVTFADVAGLSPVLHARAVLAHRGGRIEMRGARRLLQRLVRVLGLERELLGADEVGVVAGPASRPLPDAS